jgi:hypothetical protein
VVAGSAFRTAAVSLRPSRKPMWIGVRVRSRESRRVPSRGGWSFYANRVCVSRPASVLHGPPGRCCPLPACGSCRASVITFRQTDLFLSTLDKNTNPGTVNATASSTSDSHGVLPRRWSSRHRQLSAASEQPWRARKECGSPTRPTRLILPTPEAPARSSPAADLLGAEYRVSPAPQQAWRYAPGRQAIARSATNARTRALPRSSHWLPSYELTTVWWARVSMRCRSDPASP